jgi:PAS domain S-box-containing protein
MLNLLLNTISALKRSIRSDANNTFLRYGVPPLSVAVAVLLNSELQPIFHRNPFLFFYGAVMVSAWLGGLTGGLICTLLSAVAVDHLFSPFHMLRIPADDVAEIALFVTVGIVTSALSQITHAARQRVESKLRQQAALADLGRRESADQPIYALLQEATRVVADVLRVEYCKVLELVPDKSQFILCAGVGWKPGSVGQSTVNATDNSQAAFTLRSRGHVMVQHVSTETRFTAPPLLTEHGVVSGLSVVIEGEDGPYGVLGAHSRNPHAFTTEDVDFLQSVANLLSVSIQRSRKSQELAKSEARFRTLAESIPQITWSTTADGAVDYISKSWCDFTGLTMEQSLGYEGWMSVLHPDDAGWVRDRWEHSISHGERYEVECRMRTADGSYRWILARGIPMFETDGRIQKWFGTCTDIHSQRLAEEALRDAEKLSAAGRLAMTAAHEINNPLASITNLVFLAKDALDHSPTECREYLNNADHELQRVTHMVSQTLGFYKDSSSPMLTDPVETAQEVLSVYQQKINAKRIDVKVEHETVQPIVLARGDLRQVIAHVLLNAIDASPLYGAIRLRICSGCDWKIPPYSGVRISVADQGCGIPIENRTRLFQPFFTTKKDVGTGLGLWTVKGILDRHRGAIRFKSSVRPGRSGTVFSMFFPAAEVQTQTPRLSAERKAAG